MKISIFLFLVMLVNTHASTYSQNKKISLDFKDVSVENVLHEIESLSEFNFLYNDKDVDFERKVTIKAKKEQISKILQKLFLNTNIIFSVIDRQIILEQSSNKVQPPASNEEANLPEVQQLEISGVVTDKSGTPLPGVNIIIEGTTKGADTDFDGNYTIMAAKGTKLVFSYIGMVTQKITIGDSNTINVSLLDEPNELDEVVVVGYGTRKKVNLTGAVQSISAADLEARVVIDPVKALQGAIPGLNISYGNGQINSAPDINIRGFESLSGGAPLIVIDGVPSSVSQFTELNPSDVASVSTLMDASSAAIYGARAAFGVVLVTTKSASKGKLQIAFDTNASIKRPLNVPEFVLNPYDVIQARVEAAGGWYGLGWIWGDQNQTIVNADWDVLKQMSDDGTQVMLNPSDPSQYLYAGRTNWFKEAIKSISLTTTHNLSLSGSDDKVSYYLSGGTSSADGMFNYGNDEFDKYNLRTKLDFKVSDWLTLSNNTAYSADEYDEPSRGFSYAYIYNTSTTQIIKNPDGSWANSGAYVFGTASEGGRSKSSDSRYSTSFKAKGTFWDNLLTVTVQASFMKRNWFNSKTFFPVEFKTGLDNGGVYNAATEAGREGSTERQSVYDVYADLNKSFGNHDLHLLVGYNQEYRFDDWFGVSRKDLISTSVPSIQLATGDRDSFESISDWATRSGFFRFNYNYKDKYLFEVNGRYDGTSRFPQDDRFGFFPSISLGWNITKEDFFKGGISDYVSLLKPRFSYGSLGNQSVGAYAYLPTMSSGKTGAIISGEQQTTLYAPGLVSSSLTWETVRTTNIGFDLGFFKNKLSGSANYYERETIDMLTKSKQLPGVLGTSEPQDNAADLVTKGWDLSIKWRDNFQLAGSEFSYNIGGILADSRSWITAFDNPNGNLSDYYSGYEVGTIWGYEVDGLFQSEEEIANHANQSSFWSYPDKTPPGPGDIKFNDLNGDGFIRAAQTVNDLQDQRIIGNRSSRYTVGFSSGANWKGFDFSMFWQGVLKRNYYPQERAFWGLSNSPFTNLQVYNHNNRWTPETPNAYLPRLKGYAASGWSGAEMLQTNTRYLQNAWYMRLKNITLGYTLPSSFYDKVGIDKLRVYVSAENIVTLSGVKHPHIDPETLGTTYPMQSLFAFGVNLKF